MLSFYGATGQRGADLSVLINFSVNTTYGNEAEQTLAHTCTWASLCSCQCLFSCSLTDHFTDAWCGTDMSYTVYMQTWDSSRPPVATGYKEFTIDAPADISELILIEQNDIVDDWQAASYGLYDYLQVKAGDNGS